MASDPTTAYGTAIVRLSRCYLNGFMDPFLGLPEIHRLLYFAQATGESLGLRFVWHPGGPCAENFDEALEAEDLLVSIRREANDLAPTLELLPGAVENADRFVRLHPTTREHLDRVSELIDGFESPFGLELLSTVHWVVTRNGVSIRDEIVGRVHECDARKARFSPTQIGLAIDTLASRHWLP